MSLLSVKDLFATDEGKTTVKDISFDQHPGEKIAIAGETGSGKTTLLKMIGGLIQPAAGQVLLNGERVKGPDEKLIAGHPRIAYLSQYFELRNNYRVEELLDMANKLPANEVEKIYTICDVNHLLQRWTDQLSGGEKQRISLAIKLSTAPTLLLLDEPYSNLDLLHKRQMKNVIEQLGVQMGISFILVSHDAADILSWADTVFFMKDGNIVQRGSAMELYNKPCNEYCAALLGSYNLLNHDIPGLTRPEGHKNNKLFFRPENISITGPGDSSITGIVEKILYWGSYYTIDVMVEQELITVQTNTHQLKTGDRVGLIFLAEPHWM